MFKESGVIPEDTWIELGIIEKFHNLEVQMMSKASRWFISCIHGDVYFLLKFWMKNHCKWISQHMIINNNNDNNTNNDNNNNRNSGIMLQT